MKAISYCIISCLRVLCIIDGETQRRQFHAIILTIADRKTSVPLLRYKSTTKQMEVGLYSCDKNEISQDNSTVGLY